LVWSYLLLVARKIPVYFRQYILGDRHAARVQFGEGGVDRVDLIVGIMLDIGEQLGAGQSAEPGIEGMKVSHSNSRRAINSSNHADIPSSFS
jgi:hypothetical protein